jgi:hypothetical protein
VTNEILSGYAATDDREQIGRFLRLAFPLELGSFPELLSALKEQESSGNS